MITTEMLKGHWPTYQRNSLKSERMYLKIAVIGVIAIGAFVAAALLFSKNTVIGGSLIGVGSIAIIAIAIIGVKKQRHTKREAAQRASKATSYKVFTWNVGITRDYDNLCALRKKRLEGKSHAEAVSEIEGPLKLNKEEREQRKLERAALFHEIFAQNNEADIICLQESYEYSDEELSTLLPQGYTWERQEANNCGSKNCRVIWKESKFTKVSQATISYTSEYVPTLGPNEPDEILLLQDKLKGTTVCVGSAYLRGFALNYDNLEEKDRARQLLYAQSGNHQLQYDITTMNDVEADLYLIAGDYNATREHYPTRFSILSEQGYTSDLKENDPTIYDANLTDHNNAPLPVKLDHIYVRGRKLGKRKYDNVKMRTLHSAPSAMEYLSNFNRPSDHRFVRAEITVC